METKITIDKAIIDINTETSISAANIIGRTGSLSFVHAGAFTGFIKKVIPLLKDKRNIELRKTLSKTGEPITWVSIISNSTTSNVFDIFKSLGMYMPKLTLGMCASTQTMYASPKFCKDLSRYSESQRAAVLMYLITLVHFVEKFEEYCINGTYDAMTNTFKLDDVVKFSGCLRAFVNEETWYLKNGNSDDYENVTFYNTDISNINDQYANGGAIKLGIAKNVMGDCVGVAVFKLGAAVNTFIVSEHTVYTNFDLCNMEIGPDSVCAFIAQAMGKTITFKKVTNLPLSKDMEFMEFDPDMLEEFETTYKSGKWLTSWMVSMIAKGAIVADFEDFNSLAKTYGVALPLSSGMAAALSREEMCKLYEKDEYAQELYKQVKPYYETYVLGTDLDTNLKGFSNGALYSMAFVGESGTGKSTAARVIPSRCGIPYISVNFSVNIEEADLFGSMVPNPNKSRPEDPEFVWTDGIITKAVRNGYCVILEELNFARPGVLGKLNSLLDENRQIDLSTGEIVRAHPNFRIIATCNIAYEGTNRFNKALINRFDDVTVFKDLSRNDAITVIKNRTGYTNISKIAKVYDVYEALKKFATEQNVNAVVSMRQLLNIFTKGKYYSSAKDAVQRIMINGAFIEDSEYQTVFEETVFTAFDLKFKI